MPSPHCIGSSYGRGTDEGVHTCLHLQVYSTRDKLMDHPPPPDGGPRIIRTRMALQRLIIDVADMRQPLINTGAGWVDEKRATLTIHRKQPE